jgi:hypothetical protein
MTKVRTFLNNLPYHLSNLFAVLKILFFVFVVTSAISIIYLLYKDKGSVFAYFDICNSYFQAKFFVKIGFENMPITTEFAGEKHQLSAIWIVNSGEFSRIYNLVGNKIIYHITTGLGISALITAALAIFIAIKSWIKHKIENIRTAHLRSVNQRFVQPLSKPANPISIADNSKKTVIVTPAATQNILLKPEQKSHSKITPQSANNNYELRETKRGNYKLISDPKLPYPLLKKVEFIEPKENSLSIQIDEKPTLKKKRRSANKGKMPNKKSESSNQDSSRTGNKTDDFF